MQQIAVKVGKVVGGRREVYLDELLSHHIEEESLQQALDQARNQLWKSSLQEGVELGRRIYRLLNGSGHPLREALKGDEPVHFLIELPFELDLLPVELLHSEGFLLLDRKVHLLRRVTDRRSLRSTSPEKRSLKVLFFASSPADLLDAPLQFEKEEEQILDAVGKYPVEIKIEDSGGLPGLKEALYEGADHEKGGSYDIVHLTGHAGIDRRDGPVFYMEDNLGAMEKVTPDALWEAIKDFPPKILFLSGCSTGKSDKFSGSESFAYRMVEKGIPIVLGWGLPVSDEGATKFTATLYEYLAMGKGIDFAIQQARQKVKDEYYPWPLLRLFTDGSDLGPLIAPGQELRRATPRTTHHKTLAGFVGRRREIQKGVRTLKGIEGKYGLALCGPAGVGKSCLAGKLIERFHEKELIVFHGVLKKAEVLQKFRHLFDRKGHTEGLALLKSDREFEEKIKALFRSPLKEIPTFIFLDDFEQNLVLRGDEYQVGDAVIEIVKPLLVALDWAEGRSNLLITSRYPFLLEVEGRDLFTEKLELIPLMSMRVSDLEKKKKELPHIDKSSHASVEFGRGNPRLMKWLENMAQIAEPYDLDSLKRALEGKNDEYRDYLAEVLAKTEGEVFHRFLHNAAVFRRPEAAEAFAPFGGPDLLKKGVDLTLMEKGEASGEACCWVAPILRESAFGKLNDAEKKEAHRLAYRWYDAKAGRSEHPDYADLKEAIHHALASDQIREACRHVIPLGNQLDALLLYRERLEVQQRVIDRITDEVLSDAENEKDENISILFNNQGSAWNTLGDSQKAIGYYEKALQIDLAAYGGQHPTVALCYNNLGLAWDTLGDSQKAIGHYEKTLQIDLAVYGEQHPNVAIGYNNLGGAWNSLGNSQKAIGYYEKALQIDLAVYGEQHPNVAINYNNLGTAWRTMGDSQKAIGYYEKALQINLAVYGEQHPNVAINYNNLGEAWRTSGDSQKAIGYYEKALQIELAVYGEQHPNVARCYNNLGEAWKTLGDSQKAIGYLERALRIVTTVYGPDHPSTRTVRSNLEG